MVAPEYSVSLDIDTKRAHTALRRLNQSIKATQAQAMGKGRSAGNVAGATDRVAKANNRAKQSFRGLKSQMDKTNKSAKQNVSILGDLWKSFDRGTGAILRQVQLWGLLSAVLIGVQAAYAALGVVATRAGVTLRENAHQLNMNVQSLQELQFAATSVGVSVQDLRDGLGEMSTSIVDAVKGQKAAKEAFEDLDISISTLINKGNDTNAMFDKVISRLENVDSAAKRLSIAQDIFGETAGRKALKFINRMEEARNVVDQFHGAMSDRLAKSAAEVWNKIRLIWTVLKGQFIKAAAEATDTIGGLADEILRAAKRGNIFKSTLVPAINVTANVIKGLIPVGEFLYGTINTIAQNFWYVIQAAKTLIGLHLVKIITRIGGAITSATGATKGFTKAMYALGASMKFILKAGAYWALFEGIVRLYEEYRKLQDLVKNTDATFKDAAKLAVQKFGNFVVSGFATIGDLIIGVLGGITSPIVAMFSELGEQAWKAFKNSFQFQNMAQGIIGGFTGTPAGRVKKYGQDSGEEADFSKVLSSAKDAFQQSVNETMSSLQQSWNFKLFTFADDTQQKMQQRQRQQQKKPAPDYNIPELRDMDRLPDRLNTSTLLRHFEDLNTEFGEFYDKLMDVIGRGEHREIGKYLPLARRETANRIENLQAKLERTQDVMDAIQTTSHPKAGYAALGIDPERVDKAKLKVAKLRAELDRLRDRQDELARAEWMVIFETKWDKMIDSLASSVGTWQDVFIQGFRKAFDSTAQMLVNFVSKGKTEFRDLANSVVQDIIKMQYKWLMFKAIQGGKGGKSWASAGISAISSGIGAMFGGSPQTGTPAGSTNLFSWQSGISTARASGGKVEAGGTYVVGEQGREVLRMGSESGYVMPNNKSQEKQQPVNNINLNIMAADAKSFADMAKRNPQAIIGPIKEALNYGDMDLRNAVRSA